MAGARVAEVLTTLHETAKHVGGQTIKFNKSILRSIEAILRRSLESTPDGAPEVDNLRPENLQLLLPPGVEVGTNDMSSESCSQLEPQSPPEVEKNDMSSSKPSSQILM